MVDRLAAYGLTSTLLAGGVIYSALNTRPNFYAAAVALGRSSGALMVLANFALANTIYIGICFKKIFFGQLRAIEYEHLFERLWIFLTESLLALTIFRDDFSAPFAFMYGVLLFLKCFHWITADRVDYMDQIPPPGPPKLYHVRIISIIILLAVLDGVLVSYSLEKILTEGVSAMVLFASEFTILNASILGTAARYSVGLVDLRRARGRADAPPWEQKSMWLFYVDLVVDFMKLLTYLSFFLVILLHYGLPLHILRDVYMTLRSFIARCGDLVRYRRATRDMDALYPDATEEEMERGGDRTCIICREEMIPRSVAAAQGGTGDIGGPNETPKKLACGHIFHFHCLRSWLERQQSCPTCRRDVLRTPGPAPGRAAAQRNAAAANPPPAQPGAVPQPPNHQGANPIQQAYNEYFQLPRMGWDNPVPTTSTAPPAAAEAGPSRAEGIEERLQRGIWGGPIVPGNFFPAPLGAAPRTQHRQSANNLTNMPPIRTDQIRSTPSIATQSGGQPEPPSSLSRRGSRLSVPVTPQMSGSVTPFSSNPPVIFSPTGTARTIEPEEMEDDQVEVVVGNEKEVRSKVAEAALKRFGIPSSELPMGSSKGKGKEKEVVLQPVTSGTSAVNLDDWETLPAVLPTLTHASDLLIPQRAFGGQGGAGGLEDRLKVLREVDETIWGLISELTRLQSSWQTPAAVPNPIAEVPEREEGEDQDD
ncbi:uncharacterized protein I206_102821 [Kwoniella pini CBS 10737]|uniref:RING-type E3 ubiquitin transferase n=1 Tax=Kwoniella pini CBS 10737 TaxID=1296096 RepID=A0A1B9I6M4_9TREE|nr:uncharacterized protein I206_03175 [Kwoniella pini CBS 10737]OCF51109.1 hypothetical protein I206_03175 [Kwoniella pini CBS 10737]